MNLLYPTIPRLYIMPSFPYGSSPSIESPFGTGIVLKILNRPSYL